MKIFRTIVYAVLVLAVAGILIVKYSRERASVAVSKESPATLALADAQAKGLPAWVLIHSNCLPCVEMAEDWRKLEPEFEGKAAFINVDAGNRAETEFILSHKARMFPTSILFDADGKIVDRIVGVIQEDRMRDILARLLEK